MRRAAVAAAVVLASLTPTPAHAADTRACWPNAPRCAALDQQRTGLPGLDQDRDLQHEAQAWATTMAADGLLRHSAVTYGAEIVGMAPDDATVLAAFMASPEHRAIILDPALVRVGIGHATGADGTLFVSVRWDYR
jgi:uncharacterized protein YkwD